MGLFSMADFGSEKIDTLRLFGAIPAIPKFRESMLPLLAIGTRKSPILSKGKLKAFSLVGSTRE